MNKLQQAFNQLKQLNEEDSAKNKINLRKKADITEEIPGENNFKQLMETLECDKNSNKEYFKYLSEDGHQIFELRVSKDFLSELQSDFEVEDWEDWDDDGSKYGGTDITNLPDESNLEEMICDNLYLDEDMFLSEDPEAPVEGYSASKTGLVLVDHEFESHIDVQVHAEGEYFPATYWEPAEYPDYSFDGDCSCAIILYFIYDESLISEQ